jgi:hypothetical protein
MKHLLLLIAILLGGTTGLALETQDVIIQDEKKAPVEETRAVTLDVTGMT